jgi:hypothetical protein
LEKLGSLSSYFPAFRFVVITNTSKPILETLPGFIVLGTAAVGAYGVIAVALIGVVHAHGVSLAIVVVAGLKGKAHCI